MEKEIRGTYLGQVSFTTTKVQGKGAMGVMVSSIAKTQVDAIVHAGVNIHLELNQDGSWTLDTGGALVVFGIESLSSEKEEYLQEDGSFCVSRRVPVAQFGGEAELHFRGKLEEDVEGDMALLCDTKWFDLEMRGNYRLKKEE